MKLSPTSFSLHSEKLPISAIDLCCGMGGFSLAAQACGANILGGIDSWGDAIETYSRNFPTAIPIRQKIGEPETLKTCRNLAQSAEKSARSTIIISGPPCQGFSDAGSRELDDPRNQILLDLVPIFKELKPIAGLIENVATLMRSRYNPIIEELASTLLEAGYFTHPIELDAVNFGIPQKRKRLFIFVLPVRFPIESLIGHLSALHSPAKKVVDVIGDMPFPPVRPDFFSGKSVKSELPNHYAMRHSARVKKKISRIPQGKGPLSYRKLDPNTFAPTLLAGNRAPPVHYSQPRSITVREALRLQGFPDDFLIYGPFANQMRQVVNAVPFPMGKAAITVLLQVLREMGYGR